MPFLVDSVHGRAAGARPCRAFPPASHLQDRARQGRQPAGACSARATRTGTTATRKATSPSTSPRFRRPPSAISARRCRTSSSACAWWWPTGSRCCSRCRRPSGTSKPAPRRRAAGELRESIAFLRWLEAGNFTFLGSREYRALRPARERRSRAVGKAGLGVLRDPGVHVLRRGTELVDMTPEIRRFYASRPRRSSSPRPT